jgi:hypothetical protein
MTHIDDWVFDNLGSEDTTIAYAIAFFSLKRLPAVNQAEIKPIMEQHKLFCTYKDGKCYRVTGASRMGDVWLHSDHTVEQSYTNRVNVEDCKNWSKEPTKGT